MCDISYYVMGWFCKMNRCRGFVRMTSCSRRCRVLSDFAIARCDEVKRKKKAIWVSFSGRMDEKNGADANAESLYHSEELKKRGRRPLVDDERNRRRLNDRKEKKKPPGPEQEEQDQEEELWKGRQTSCDEVVAFS